jgi:hypothetical protein
MKEYQGKNIARLLKIIDLLIDMEKVKEELIQGSKANPNRTIIDMTSFNNR